MDFGAAVSSRYRGLVWWAPLTQSRWYNVQVNDVSLGGKSLGLPPCAYSYLNDQIGSFIDRSLSFIGCAYLQLYISPLSFFSV